MLPIASMSAGSDAGSMRATRFTRIARWLVPNTPDVNPPTTVRAACVGGADNTGTRSGTIANSGSSAIASIEAGARAVHANRGDHSIIHWPSDPAATVARAWRVASVRWR